jgi:hypothetical protein
MIVGDLVLMQDKISDRQVDFLYLYLTLTFNTSLNFGKSG